MGQKAKDALAELHLNFNECQEVGWIIRKIKV